MIDYRPDYYTPDFLAYLSKAGVTGFDFYLTVQEEGMAVALGIVEHKLRKK